MFCVDGDRETRDGDGGAGAVETVETEGVSLADDLDTACYIGRVAGNARRALWEITSRCNLACGHCFATATGLEEPLEEGDCDRIVAGLRAAGVRKLALTGGEPLLSPLAFHAVESAVAAGMHVDINTNATLIDRDAARRLVASGAAELTTGLCCVDPRLAERVYGDSGVPSRVLEGIERSASAGLRVGAVIVVGLGTTPDLENTVRALAAAGVSSIAVTRVVVPADGAMRGRLRRPPGEAEVEEAAAVVRGMRGMRGVPPLRGCRLVRHSPLCECPAGDGVFAIDSSGRVHPCFLLRSPDAPDVRFASIEEALSSPPFQRIRDRIRARMSECASCEARDECGRGCAAFRGPDPLCSRLHPSASPTIVAGGGGAPW